ncbi:MAG: hypothetical protein AYK19_07965 [Theionarchaea archaeon DG-70-1]|nr:MAG: hypothetical protein AYK19_07965 [Theionarchaea archaeon DG-70-1]
MLTTRPEVENAYLPEVAVSPSTVCPGTTCPPGDDLPDPRITRHLISQVYSAILKHYVYEFTN